MSDAHRRSFLRVLPLLALAGALTPGPSQAWQVSLSGAQFVADDVARAVAVTSSGDVLVAGRLSCVATVVKLGRGGGTTVWQRVAGGGSGCGLGDDGPGPPKLALEADGGIVVAGGAGVSRLNADGTTLWALSLEIGEIASVQALALDPVGDVVLAGFVVTTDDAPGAWDFLVLKLDGATGAERWRTTLTGTPSPFPLQDYYADESTDLASAVTVDTAGDVVAAGRLESLGEPRMAVVKLAGATGSVLWRDDGASGQAEAVAVDGAGEVLVGGRDLGVDVLVRKLAATTGAERWRHTLAGDAPPEAQGSVALALAPDGDAIVSAAIADLTTGSDVAVARLAGLNGAERWRTVVDGPGDGPDFPYALALTPNGKVMVAGTLSPAGMDRDLAALAIDAGTGAPLWHTMIEGSAGDADSGLALALAPEGDVVVGGVTRNVGTGPDMTAVKLAGKDGSTRWRRDLAGTSDGSDDGGAVVTAANGDVIAAGRLFNGYSLSWDFTVARFAGTGGAERWRQEINGRSFGYTSGNDEAVALAIDARGDVAAVGTIAREDRYRAFAVVKLEGATGREQWRAVIAGTWFAGEDAARAVAFDPAGDVVAAGLLENADRGSVPEFFVVKLDGATGEERWRQLVPDRPGEAVAVAVDQRGDVLVAGTLAAPFASADFAVLKLAGDTGEQRWRHLLSGLRTYKSRARALAVDAQGDVVVGGEVVSTTGGDVTVTKLDGATGNERWRSTLDDDEMRGRFAPDLALDGFGNVFLIVAFEDATQAPSLGAVKLAGDSGDQLWRRTLAPDIFTTRGGVAVDAAGDLVVTGKARGDLDEDLLVVKLAGSGGAERWRRTIAGTAQPTTAVVRDDEGVDIALDAAGDVAVVGQLVNAGSGFDMAVVKLRGRDGSDGLAVDAQRCRRALRRAGAEILLTRLAAHQRCRNAINAGQSALDPAACAGAQATRNATVIAGLRGRAHIAASCTDALLGDLRTCAGSVDGVVTVDGQNGCLVARHVAAADAMIGAQYGRVLGSDEGAARACQLAIARGGRHLARRLVAGLYGCSRAADRGRGAAVSCSEAVMSAQRTLRATLIGACDDTLVAAVAPCADDVDGLAPPAGGGCLAVIETGAIRDALAAIVP